MSIRAAFYYPWFPETWGSGTDYHPSMGAYDTDLGTVQVHLALMRYARCRAAIASWWGPQSPYDGRIATCLQAAEGTGFKWALYYEREGYENPSAAQISDDLAYVMARYVSHPNYMRIRGKPVVFAYADPTDGAAMVSRWMTAAAGRFHVCLKLFTGFDTAPQPDSWHEYAPAQARSDFAPWCVTVSPGFDKAGEAVRLPRDPDRFRDDVRAMSGSGAYWQLVTTFNEWGEGTAVEPELSWGTTYLDILARN